MLPFVLGACSGLEPLDADRLNAARALWSSHRPDLYRATIQMRGERIEAGRFDVIVRAGEVASITLNGQTVQPSRVGDYTIDGLLGILEQELELADTPGLLGAPAGYSARLSARFDPETGRLIQYRRTVEGASSSIEIEVLAFETGAP